MTTSPPVSGNNGGDYAAVPAMPGRRRGYHALCWERDGQHWPNRQASRFVEAGGIRWHLQIMGQGPVLLLLHGTGASSHSWRELLPLLAQHYTVVAPDLPGHGFTRMPAPEMLSLPGMSQLLESLLRTLKRSPRLVVGHSAGAAIAAWMCLHDSMAPQWLVSINGALLPLNGVPGYLYAPIARWLACGDIWARLLARSAADRWAVERLIARTGSVIEPEGIDGYRRLLRTTGHTAAALGMMARWDLRALQRQLPDLQPQLVLVVGENDLMVPPQQAERLADLLPAARLVRLAGCGHLLHEERPQAIAILLESLDRAGHGERIR